MATAAKPGADLLWAFQLHRENGALSKRLKALENSTTQQQDRIAASEQERHSAHKERFDALAKQLQSLQESDVTEQVAGLASELRATRQQADQVCDKVKNIETASKEADGINQERERAVHGRFGDMESTVAQVQRTLLGFEGRLQQLAAQHGAHVAVERLEQMRQQHADEISGLKGRLRSLQDAHHELRALVEGVVRDCRRAPVIAPAIGQASTAALNVAAASHATAMPKSQCVDTALAQTTTAPLKTTAASHTTIIPDSRPAKAPQAKQPARTKRYKKEIASLKNGEGSLTNAPDIMLSQLPLESTETAGKKRKAPADEGPLLRSAFPQRETRSQVKKIKEEPLVTRAKAPVVKPSRQTASKVKPTGKTGATHQAANSTTQVKKEPGRNPRRARGPTNTPDISPPQLSSDRVVVADVVDSPTLLPLAARGKGKGNGEGNGKGKTGVKLEQQPQEPRRRRIKQDDSMEEFLAKARASTGGN